MYWPSEIRSDRNVIGTYSSQLLEHILKRFLTFFKKGYSYRTVRIRFESQRNGKVLNLPTQPRLHYSFFSISFTTYLSSSSSSSSFSMTLTILCSTVYLLLLLSSFLHTSLARYLTLAVGCNTTQQYNKKILQALIHIISNNAVFLKI